MYTYMHTEVNCYRKSCTSVSNARYFVCLLPSLKIVGDTLLGLASAVHLDTIFFPANRKYDPYSLGQPETTFPCTVTLNVVGRNGTDPDIV